ncbi:MAG: hypothetical protein U0235_20950 [Polyangiaceae bacterium]
MNFLAPSPTRRRASRVLSAVLVTSFLMSTSLAPRAAFAQTDDATTKAARARFQEGVSLYDKGQYEAARAAFLQAYALRKHPAVLLNLAQSSLRSGRPLEASKYFQQYLRESSNLTAAQRRRRQENHRGAHQARTPRRSRADERGDLGRRHARRQRAAQ